MATSVMTVMLLNNGPLVLSPSLSKPAENKSTKTVTDQQVVELLKEEIRIVKKK
jgi:hypothetical protein